MAEERNEVLMDHFHRPRNAGELSEADAVVSVMNPVCGDRMKLAIKVDGHRIVEARFKTYGCSTAIAASSMTTEMIIGKSLDEARAIKNQDVADALGGLTETSIHCSVLAEDALKAVLDEYENSPS